MLRTVLKNQRSLYIVALLTAAVLCAVFTIGGITSFFEVSIGEETNFNDQSFNGMSWVRLLATLTYLSLCLFYLVWLLRRKSFSNDFSFKQILKPALPFLGLAWIAYPLSNDIYLYLQYGVMGLRGVNPYITPASNVSTLLHPLLYWLQTSTYGPISQQFFMGSALFVRISPILSVYVFKIFCLFVYIINAYLIWRLLNASPNRHWLTAAYLLNPYLLMAQIADAHVDVFLCFSVILMIGCLHSRWYVVAILEIVAGFLTKTLPIIWLPLVIGFLVWRRRWRTLAIAAAACSMILLLLSHTAFPALSAWKSLLNPGVSGFTARSIHHLVNLLVSLLTGSTFYENRILIQQLTRVTFLGFAVFYGWKLLQPYLKQKYSEADLVSDLGWITLALLLGATPWLMPWYPSVLLPFAVLSVNAPIFSLTCFVFCLTTGAVIGAGSGNTPLSLLGCLLTLVPALSVLLWRQRVLQKVQPMLVQPESAVQPAEGVLCSNR